MTTPLSDIKKAMEAGPTALIQKNDDGKLITIANAELQSWRGTKWEWAIEKWTNATPLYAIDIAALIEALEADKARLDWMMRNADPAELGLDLGWWESDSEYRSKFIAAIDAARSEM